MARWRSPLALLGLSVALQVFTLGDRWGAPDERERVAAAESLLDRGTLRPGGGAHTKYPPLTSVLLAPGVLLRRVMPGHAEGWLMVPPLLASAACVVPFHHALMVSGVAARAALGASALFALANPTWPYGKRLYSEPFTALMVLCAFAAALAYRRTPRLMSLVLAWLCLLGAVGNNSVALVLGPVLWVLGARTVGLAHVAWDRTALKVGAVLGALVVLLWMAVNVVKFGSPLSTGYADSTIANDVFDGRNGFSTPVWVGLHGLLFSAGRGLVVYAPLSLVGLWFLRRERDAWHGAALPLFLGVAVPLVVYSGWWSWHGGTCYGPRLLTPFLGLWMLGLGPALQRTLSALESGAVVLASGLSTLACVVGTFFTFSYDQQFWIRDKPFNDYLDVYTPQYSQLPRFLRAAVLFPDDMNWLWLEHGPRESPTWTLPQAAALVEVNLRGQAARDAWEVSEVTGADASGSAVPVVSVETSAGDGAAAMDGQESTRWRLPNQREGQWVRVTFAQPVTSVRFVHGKEGTGYPRFAEVKAGGRSVPAVTPRGWLQWRWPAWVMVLVWMACAWVLRGTRNEALNA